MLISSSSLSQPAQFLPILSAALGLVTLFIFTYKYNPFSNSDASLLRPPEGKPPSQYSWLSRPSFYHPIDDLVKSAQERFDRLMHAVAETPTLHKAAAAYREKRGRHPPPDFDKWFHFATSRNALVIEDMFDQIYHDLEPFWSLDPAAIREETLKWPFMFSIRNGKAEKRAARAVNGEWLGYWLRMLEDIEGYLPDVDMAINALDESRVIVPWEDMNEHMKLAATTRSLDIPRDRSQIVTEYPKLQKLSFKIEDIGFKGLKLPEGKGPWNQETPFWKLTQTACPPGSPARDFVQDPNVSEPPTFQLDLPNGTHNGYISNWTDSKNVCTHPHFANLYGTFVNPRFNSVNQTLVPLFSGCKIQNVNNEILLPAAKYFSDEDDFDFHGSSFPWDAMKNAIVWRGQATGGAHKKENWKRFHRHRFIAMLNGSMVSQEERWQEDILELQQATGGGTANVQPGLDGQLSDKEDTLPHNFPIPGSPNNNPWNLSALSIEPTSLGEWIGAKANAGFHHLMCAPWTLSILGKGMHCGYMDPYFVVKDRMPMSEQFSYKYLPDIDGNSYSGRYRAFMLSNSLPIKSTIWSEWHDSRLIPWKHFVPMDNTYVDFWGIMEYFLGYGWREGDNQDPELQKPHHDQVAKMIAEDGREWAERVLRKEDMVIYAYRLILEYKRVTSDGRAKMMFVNDI